MPVPAASPEILYAQTAPISQTVGGNYAPISGLQLTLPEGVSTQNALVILNVPNPYATGTDFPGGEFAIIVDGVRQGPFASFTYQLESPTGGQCARMPTTLAVSVPLKQQTQTVKVYWQGVRNATVHLDTLATLSAVVI